MADLTLGVVATSRKPDERRQAIHPAHLERIDAELRARMLFEHGYGDQLGSSDEEIRPLVGGLRSRAELIEQIRVTLHHEVGHLRGEDDLELAARGLE